MCSLARVVSVMPLVAFMNASSTILERTLDDSAARRIVIPEAFLAVDECLAIYEGLLRGVRVYPAMIRKNLERFGPFAGTEAVMMELVEKGEDRQASARAHQGKIVRRLGRGDAGEAQPAREAPLRGARSISSRVSKERVMQLLDPSTHTGIAEEACEEFLTKVVSPLLKGHAKASRSKVQF